MQSPSAVVTHGAAGVVSGTFAQELVVGSQRVDGSGELDAFAVMVSSSGTPWLTAIQGSQDDSILSMNAHADGVTLLGYASPDAVITTSFPDGSREASLKQPADPAKLDHHAQPLLVELTLEGRPRRVLRFAGTGYNSFTASAQSTDGKLFVAGEVSGTLRIADTELSGFARAFVSSFDAAGNVAWTLPFAGDGEAFITQLATSDAGVFVTGNFTGALQVGEHRLSAVTALTQTPYLVHVSNSGAVLFATAALGHAIADHEQTSTGHSEHSAHEHHAKPQTQTHAGHAAFEVSDPHVVSLANGHALIATSYGATFGMHGGDFEASSSGQLALVTVDAGGSPKRADFAQGNATLSANLDLIRDGERVLLVTSLSGELEIAGESLHSTPGRSVFVLDWTEREGLHSARKFGQLNTSLTSNAACLGAGALWSAARSVDVESAEQNVLLSRFKLSERTR
jgi:hypothetical protein